MKSIWLKKLSYIAASIFCAVLLIWLMFFRLPSTYTTVSLAGRVVDAESGAPLENAIVIVIWELERGFGLEGTILSGYMHIEEVLTDEEGNYHIDGWGPRQRTSGTYLGHNAPKLIVFKEDYDFFARGNLYDSIFKDNRRESVHHSSWDGETIKLIKFEGNLEAYYIVLRRASWSLDVIFDSIFGAQPCDWKKIPMMVKLFDQYYKELVEQSENRITYHLPNVSNLVQTGDCGTEEEFFQGGR